MMTENHPILSGRLVARDLMLEEVTSIGADQSLGEARQALTSLQSDANTPNTLLVVEQDGSYAGILTARLLLLHLVGTSLPEAGPVDRQEEWYGGLLVEARARSKRAIREVLATELPVVGPDDGLAILIKHGCEHRMEFIPVVEDGRPLGVVPITAVFTAAAALALRPDDEGIQVGATRVK